ncbi:MAG: carbohydrate porin [Sulfuricella denitrificans]|nr:carbohydrate porin [Sulfuricella denitrificans]
MARNAQFKIKTIAMAAAVMCATLPAHGGEASQEELLKEMKRLSARLEKLEKNNADLEKKLQVRNEPLAPRVQALEDYNIRIEKSLASENVSENEPELTARLKAAEYQGLEMQKSSKVIESLDGIHAGASFTTVAQKTSGTDNKDIHLNYRTDITVSTPAGTMGDATGMLFGHFRIGQGKGASDALTAFSGPNATAFQLGTADLADTTAVMLAQAWYQADIPLPIGGFKPRSRETLTINFGKMDPFGFFDQNAAANDEGRQFLSSIFVHNALLDNPMAANVGADAYGFTPGVRLSYLNEKSKPENYRLSLGVFGSGHGANFSQAFTSPFIIAQAETRQVLFSGLAGNYRVYAWHNGQAPTYNRETVVHRGIGFNFDQRLDDYVTLFGRYGKGWGEGQPFDQTVSMGAEFGGSYWSRGGDALGMAFGMNKVSAGFSRDSSSVDADGDGKPDFGFHASGSEKVMEIYYRHRLNKQFEVTPDFQYILHPAGNGDAPDVKILGARAQLMF